MAKNRGIKTEDRYWDAREREMKNLVQQEKFLKRYDKNVKEIYRRMLYDAQKEIESFYGRYASKEGITISEAKKRVSRMDVEAFGKMAEHMVETKDFSPEANAALRLYNLTMKVNRLELLKARIGLRLVDGFDEIDKLTETLLTNAGVDEFKRQAGILGESVINPEQKAEAIAKSSFQNATFSDRIWMYQDQLRNEIANDLRSGLIQGKNSQEMARKLRKRFGVSMYNASRLARTEMARVQTEAQMQSFERNGYTHYVFIARESACDHCAPLDGKVLEVKDIRPGVNAPPIHPHCFCSIAAATTEQVQAKEVAGKHIERMKKIEPKITADLSKIAAETNAQMAGLEYRLKTEVSLARKIVKDAEEKSVSLQEADNKIRDVLRYTMLRDEKNFTDGYFATQDALIKNGYRIERVKNTWKDGAVYKGVNTIIADSHGNEFELQFHTRKSFEVKEGELHKLYERYRSLDPEENFQERAELKAKMVRLSDTIPNPNEIDNIISRSTL